ncbi:hypothetical protein [Bacillus safensis]|uniref:hypothetical protein n=1 Tax=Bacillus safensis TaxID=561879 RepID=UPI002E221F24|nr:hypothetical protein [Bacillus safensis]
MEKLTLEDLSRNESWEEAVVVFTPNSFDREFSETERSYRITRDNKYFSSSKNGNSLFGDCLDGKDLGVRLDIYMSLWLPSEGKQWNVDYCYITK